MGKVLVNLFTRPWSGWEVTAFLKTAIGRLLYWLETTCHLISGRKVGIVDYEKLFSRIRGNQWYWRFIIFQRSCVNVDQTKFMFKRSGVCICSFHFSSLFVLSLLIPYLCSWNFELRHVSCCEMLYFVSSCMIQSQELNKHSTVCRNLYHSMLCSL